MRARTFVRMISAPIMVLPAAGRRHEDDAALLLLDAAMKFVDHVALIRAQLGASCCTRSRARMLQAGPGARLRMRRHNRAQAVVLDQPVAVAGVD